MVSSGEFTTWGTNTIDGQAFTFVKVAGEETVFYAVLDAGGMDAIDEAIDFEDRRIVKKEYE
jgi:hypothetical protein